MLVFVVPLRFDSASFLRSVRPFAFVCPFCVSVPFAFARRVPFRPSFRLSHVCSVIYKRLHFVVSVACCSLRSPSRFRFVLRCALLRLCLSVSSSLLIVPIRLRLRSLFRSVVVVVVRFRCVVVVLLFRFTYAFALSFASSPSLFSVSPSVFVCFRFVL